MSSKGYDLEKTKTPGIYRRGERYVVVYRMPDGRQRRETVATFKAATALKAVRAADIERGEFHDDSKILFGEYALEWVARYQGTRRGFSERTREEYRRDLKAYAIPRLGKRRISQVSPSDIARFIAWLSEQPADRGRPKRGEQDDDEPAKLLSDASIRRILAPVRSCLATARREGLIRHNPARDAAIPNRRRVVEDDERVKALTAAELARLLASVDERHRVLLELLASTGLRIGEALALRWRDVDLGARPAVRVRRAFDNRGREVPPKSRHGRRRVPLSPSIAAEMRLCQAQTDWARPDDLVFCTGAGARLDPDNLRRRALTPAMRAAGVNPPLGFHALRHTFASMHVARGTNVVQLARLLGHHSAAFTLSVYAHLMDEGVGDALDIAATTSATTSATRPGDTQPECAPHDSAFLQAFPDDATLRPAT